MTVSSQPVFIVAFGESENLGVGYLISVLTVAGIPARMIDFRYDNEEILSAIRREKPIAVGFSVIFEAFINEYVLLARYLRKGGIDCHFTAGGFYASLHPEELFGMIPELDSIVRFEGEYTLPELVNCLRTHTDWRTIKSIAYRADGIIITTPLRSLEKDLDQFPFPARRTLREYTPGQQYAALIAGRGCVYNCSFCNTSEYYSRAGGPLKRIRRAEAVVSEMHHLYSEKGCRIFLFQDDDSPVRTAGGNGWMKSFCSELERSGLMGKVIWKINCRPDEIEPETFSMMKQHGMFLVFIGLDEGTDEGLMRFNKKMTVASSLRGVGILGELGIEFDYGMIMFHPETTFASLRENLQFLQTVCSVGRVPMSFLKLIPYFDTKVEKELRDAGRLKGRPGNLSYNFRSESLDACWAAVSECFAEWQWGRQGLVNHARWIRNCISVIDAFGQRNASVDEYREVCGELVARSNLCISETLSDLFDYYESGDYLRDGEKRKVEIRADTEQKYQTFGNTLNRTLRSLLQLS